MLKPHKHILLGALLSVFSTLSMATGQMGEQITLEGKTLYTKNYPYLDANIPIGMPSCTGLWRGYQGKWSITEGQLYLNEVVTHAPADPKQADLFEKLPEYEGCAGNYRVRLDKIYKQVAPIPATWYSGRFTLVDGKVLEYVHMGFESTFEQTIDLTFEKGVLKHKRVLNFTRAFAACGSQSGTKWQPKPECMPDLVEDSFY